MQGRQVLEDRLVFSNFWIVEVDRLDSQQRKVLLVVFRRADLARDRVARPQTKSLNLRVGDINVVGARQVVIARRAEKAESLFQNLQSALGKDQPTALSLVLEDGEDQLLLAQRSAIYNFQFLGQLLEIQDVHALEFDNIHFLRSIDRRHLFLATFLAVKVQELEADIQVQCGTALEVPRAIARIGLLKAVVPLRH